MSVCSMDTYKIFSAKAARAKHMKKKKSERKEINSKLSQEIRMDPVKFSKLDVEHSINCTVQTLYAPLLFLGSFLHLYYSQIVLSLTCPQKVRNVSELFMGVVNSNSL